MEGRQDMRASDRERQEVVNRLRAALEEGRLRMEEYLERMGLAYQAVTYGDLAPLCADLPAQELVAERDGAAPATPQPAAAPTVVESPAPPARRGWIAGLPVTLKVLWTIWLVAVSVNVVIWILVSSTTGHFIYPWPIWVAGPYGAALFGVSAGVRQIRRGRQDAAQRRQLGRG